MDINWVKIIINGVNWVKIGHFGENGQNRVILAYFEAKMTSSVIIFSRKFLKIISGRFMDRNLVKNVIKGVNLAKIGHFLVKMVKIGSFLGPK